MPLLKKGALVDAPLQAPAIAQQVQNIHPPAKKLGGVREAGAKAAAPMTKDSYWERKEARDIETGIRIRRSGVWQAALQSMGVQQLNTANTFESFIALVEKTADAGLGYVNRD